MPRWSGLAAVFMVRQLWRYWQRTSKEVNKSENIKTKYNSPQNGSLLDKISNSLTIWLLNLKKF